VIVVKVELHHAKHPGKVTELGRMVIHNVGGTMLHGDYRVALGRKGQCCDTGAVLRKPQREGRVLRHARLRESVWRLIAKAIASVGHGGEP
jgi:hypothetical protein